MTTKVSPLNRKYPQGHCFKCGTKSHRDDANAAFTCKSCGRFNPSAATAQKIAKALQDAIKLAQDDPKEFLRRMKKGKGNDADDQG